MYLRIQRERTVIMGIKNDDQPTYNIRMMQKDKDINPHAYEFMQFACSAISSFGNDNMPIVMMAIINALAALINSKEDLVFVVDISRKFIAEMILLNTTPQGIPS